MRQVDAGVDLRNSHVAAGRDLVQPVEIKRARALHRVVRIVAGQRAEQLHRLHRLDARIRSQLRGVSRGCPAAIVITKQCRPSAGIGQSSASVMPWSRAHRKPGGQTRACRA